MALAWKYQSPIGPLYISPLKDGRYGLYHNGTVWEACDSPQAEADNVYMHVTGCYEWDMLDGTVDGPTDLSEWELVNI